MKAFNKIILGFILSISVSATEAQTTNSMFANSQPTKRIYSDNETILPNYLQYEKAGTSENILESTIDNNLVKISWQTKKETNTSHFELQRSIDGQNFEPIETIAANGLSQKSCSYSTTDIPHIVNQPLYYRVKSVFVNGKEAFTEVLTIAPTLCGQTSGNK